MTVREHYSERIKNSASCCASGDCCGPESSLYPADLLATLPFDESDEYPECGISLGLSLGIANRLRQCGCHLELRDQPCS